MGKNDDSSCFGGCLVPIINLALVGLACFIISNSTALLIVLGIITLCALLCIIYVLRQDKLLSGAVITLGIVLAIILCMVFCANVFPNYFKLIMVALLFISFIVFSILQIIKSRKGKKTDENKPEIIIHSTTQYTSILKESRDSKTKEDIKSQKEEVTPKEMKDFVLKLRAKAIKEIQQGTVNQHLTIQYNRIKTDYPHGYDEWSKTIENKPIDNYEKLVVDNEEEIKRLEDAYQEQKKKEDEKNRRQAEDIIWEYPNGFSKWRKCHPNLSETLIMGLAVRERARIVQLEEEHLRGEYNFIVEQYPHGWHEWDKTIKKEEIESYLCLTVKSKNKIKKLEEKWQEQENKKVEYNSIKTDYPHGYDEWYGNLPADKINDCIDWAIKEEDVIKHLEEQYQEREKVNIEKKERHEFFVKYKFPFILEHHLNKIKGTPYYYFFNYYPKNKFEYDITDIDSRVRRFIWDFKDGKKDIADMVSTKIKRLIRENLDKYTFVCIPASTQVDNNRRYKKFMEQVCETTGMANGYSYVEIVEDGDRIHMGGKKDVYYYCDREFFKDRLVVVFDDIYTHGRHLNWMILNLYSAGAKVVLALFLGKTSNEIIRNHPWVKEQMIKNMSEYILIKTEEDEDNEDFLQLQEISKRLKSALIQEILKGGKFSFNLEEQERKVKDLIEMENKFKNIGGPPPEIELPPLSPRKK